MDRGTKPSSRSKYAEKISIRGFLLLCCVTRWPETASDFASFFYGGQLGTLRRTRKTLLHLLCHTDTVLTIPIQETFTCFIGYLVQESMLHHHHIASTVGCTVHTDIIWIECISKTCLLVLNFRKMTYRKITDPMFSCEIFR